MVAALNVKGLAGKCSQLNRPGTAFREDYKWGLDIVTTTLLENYLSFSEMCHQTCLIPVWGSERRCVPIRVGQLKLPALMHSLAEGPLTLASSSWCRVERGRAGFVTS